MQSNIVRIFTRIFVEADEVDRTTLFYCTLLGGQEVQRFDYRDMGLLVVSVTSPTLSVLIIGGPEENRKRFESTSLTVAVVSLEKAIASLAQLGAVQLEEIQKTPKGRKTRFAHPDGLIAEYVENEDFKQ